MTEFSATRSDIEDAEVRSEVSARAFAKKVYGATNDGDGGPLDRRKTARSEWENEVELGVRDKLPRGEFSGDPESPRFSLFHPPKLHRNGLPRLLNLGIVANMGAQWKHAGQQANANKRGAIIGKLVKEIIVSAKIGEPNPDNNSRLRIALEAARKGSVPRDTIERAIKRATGQLGEINYETVLYEGFTPHRVPVIVECLTDNKNRTASDVRVLFRKGTLGAMGSMSFLFDRLGVIEATRPGKHDIEEAAIEAGAQSVEPMSTENDPGASGSTGARFTCDPSDLDAASKALTALGWAVSQAELSYIAKTPVTVPEPDRKEVIDFLEALDDNDDVHRIYTALA